MKDVPPKCSDCGRFIGYRDRKAVTAFYPDTPFGPEEMMTIQIGDVFKSNRGKGPLIATCLNIYAGGIAVLSRRWLKGSGKEIYFQLPVSYFGKRSCGWVKIEVTHDPARRTLFTRRLPGRAAGTSAAGPEESDPVGTAD